MFNFLRLKGMFFLSSGIMEPVVTLKRKEQDVSFDLCIFCQESSRTKDTVFHQTEKGITTIKEATELRRKLRHCEFRSAVDRLTSIFLETSDKAPELKWHRQCYSGYTHKRRINAKLEKELSTAQPEKDIPTKTQGKGHAFLHSYSVKVDWTLCLFCQNSGNKQKTSRVSTLNMSSKICTNAKYVH